MERKSKELEPLLVELATLQRKQVCAMSQKQFVQQKLDALQSQVCIRFIFAPFFSFTLINLVCNGS